MNHMQRVALGATAALALATAGCGGQGTPAVTASPGQVGRWVWHDLVTREAAAARKFYGTLFGWEFEETAREGRPYFIARLGEDVVGGIIEVKGGDETRPATWLSYLAVADLTGAVEQVTSGGGKVLLAPRAAGDYGVIAIVSDPQGAPLGLAVVTDKVRGDTPKPRRHQFFWMEYLAKDGAAALDFYQTLAGYTTEKPRSLAGTEYHVLSKERPRAGLFEINPRSNVQPNWLPYLLVENPAGFAARVEGLGGKVLLAPHMDIRGGSLTVVADPTGGAIALQKWPK